MSCRDAGSFSIFYRSRLICIVTMAVFSRESIPQNWSYRAVLEKTILGFSAKNKTAQTPYWSYRLLSLYRPPALLGEYGQTSDVNGLGTYFPLVFQQPLMNLDMRAYPGHQLCGAEELYQIVVRIQAHPPDFIHMLFFGC